MLIRIIKNILSIAVSNIEVKRLFNQDHNVFYYCCKRLQTKTIKILMILHIHIDQNSNDINTISNTSDDSKLNEQYSKNELKNNHRDINVFVNTNSKNES